MRLQAQGLAFEYPGGVHAVRGIDLDLSAGELVCVIGPNGAGKSTLVQLLGGLLKPTSGRVTIDGRRLAQLGYRERARRLAIVPQALRHVPEIDVESFVLGGRYGHLDVWRRHSSQRERVHAALEAADVAELGSRLLTDISGGQRQRVLIARALAQESEVMLIDEPTSSLDPEHQLAIFGLVARLSCEGRAVFVVTHDLNLASQFATRIALVTDGRIAAEGPPEAVLTPDVLEPVYGRHLRFGSFPAPYGGGTRPFVVSWLDPTAAAGETAREL